MATRPKQRVLVRWNDDLDKALLLFITHICSESGIKIPYDEVARRMGSTFTEGAITQHLSKLRTKMAELNVVPVPAASKRGAITNKPSSVYAQKSRGGPPLQRPVASKTQAKSAASRNTRTIERPKRATRRKTDFIKRSESDDGQTDDEFGGDSDDDFMVEGSASGKRKAGANNHQDQARKKANNAKDHRAHTDQHAVFVDESVEEMMEGRDITSHYGQVSHAAGSEEEEEDNRATIAPSHFTPPTTHMANPFQFGHNNHLNSSWNPHLTTQSDNPFRYNSAQTFVSSFPAAHKPISGYPTAPSFISPFQSPGPINTYLPMSEANEIDMSKVGNGHPSSPHPSTRTVRSNYPGAQPLPRNDSMVSGSSQMTYSAPATPSANHPGGFDGAHSSPYSYNSWSPNGTTGQPVFEQPTIQNQVSDNVWGFDGQFDMNHTQPHEIVDENSIGNAFASELFG